MSVSLKLIASAVGVTGAIGGAVGTALWQTGSFSGRATEITSPNSPAVTVSSVGTEQDTIAKLSPAPKKGNCEVIELSDSNIFSELDIEEAFYTALYCTEVNSEASEKKMMDSWTGLFPDGMFRSSYSDLDVGNFINLKVKKESIETTGNLKVTFESDKFWDSSLVGETDGTTKQISGREVKTIKVTSEEYQNEGNIYLFLEQRI